MDRESSGLRSFVACPLEVSRGHFSASFWDSAFCRSADMLGVGIDVSSRPLYRRKAMVAYFALLARLITRSEISSQLEGKRMSSTAEIFLKATLVGVGGTIVLDFFTLMMSRVLAAGNELGSGRPLVRQYGSWPIRSARDEQGRAGQGRTDDRLDGALRNRHRLWAPAGSAVGQGLARATDTPSSDDLRLGAAGRALFS